MGEVVGDDAKARERDTRGQNGRGDLVELHTVHLATLLCDPARARLRAPERPAYVARHTRQPPELRQPTGMSASHPLRIAGRPIVVIPARLASQRLPNKPLALIGGVPMVVIVWQRAMAAAIGPVVVAVCEEEVAAAVREAGGTAVMTDPDLPSGSDRVHAALQTVDPAGEHDVVVNLQGDLPSVPPEMLQAVLQPLSDGDYDLATLVATIGSKAEAAAPSVVKAVCAFGPDRETAPALYFSRNAVPWGDGPLYHHIGIYAWRRQALSHFVSLPPSPLELREKTRAAARAGSRHAHRRRAREPCAIRYRYARGSGARTRGKWGFAPMSSEAAILPIAFQGLPGAYSDLACRTAYPGRPTLPCATFEMAIEAVHSGRAELAMLPCENSLAGRVPDIHSLLPQSGLSIIGEHFQRVEHCLLAPRGAAIGGVRRIHSHAVALGQVRRIVRELGAVSVVEADTAGSAQLVAEWGKL